MEPKVNINRPKVDDAEIESRKNFQELVNKFKNESLQKAKKDLRLRRLKKIVYSTVIAGAAVVCTVTFINHNSDDGNKNKNLTSVDQAAKEKKQELRDNSKSKFIQPITQKSQVAYSKYKVNAKHGGTITHNKSKITIPANSFVKKSGEELSGDVEIQYREMHDQAEILASGIPMTYDSAGVRYHFESAGMIDIKGYQNGEEVNIKTGKRLKVEMASAEQGTKFNLYELDTVSKNWVCRGKDKVSVELNGQEVKPVQVDEQKILQHPIVLKIDEKIKTIEEKKVNDKSETEKKIVALPRVGEKPLAPKEGKAGRPSFELDVDPTEHPELSMYKEVTFEVGEENKHYDKSWNLITWSDAQLTDGPQKGINYQLHLALGSRREKLIVYPVLKGQSLEKAKKEFEKKFTQYETALRKKEAEEQKLKRELEEKIAAYNAEQAKLSEQRQKEIIKIRKKQEEELATQFNNLDNEAKITRTFLVSNFGIFNADCAIPFLSGASYDATFSSGSLSLHPRKVFLVSHDKNLLITIGDDKFTHFGLPDDGTYSLCCAINNNVYVCEAGKFKNTQPANGKINYDLVAITPEVESVLDLRKGLGLVK